MVDNAPHLRHLPGKGPTVLWVHGYTMDGSIWDDLWERLPGFDHVALDLPGHGQTPSISGGALARSSEALLMAANITCAERVVAMSFGGAVTLSALISRPDTFRITVLAAPGLPGGPEDVDAATCHLELLQMVRERGIGPWLAKRWMSVPPLIFAGVRSKPEVFARVAAIVERHKWSELVSGDFGDIRRAAIGNHALAQIRTKMTVLIGEEDMPAFKRIAEIIRRSVPGALRKSIAQVGHMPLLENPSSCVPLLEEALK